MKPRRNNGERIIFQPDDINGRFLSIFSHEEIVGRYISLVVDPEDVSAIMDMDIDVRDKYIQRKGPEQVGTYKSLGGITLLSDDTETAKSWHLRDAVFVEMSPHAEVTKTANSPLSKAV